MPALSDAIVTSSTPETEQEKLLYAEVSLLQKKCLTLERDVQESKSYTSDARALQDEIKKASDSITEFDNKIHQNQQVLRNLEAIYREHVSKTSSQGEDSLIDTLEKELVQLSNRAIKLEAECKTKEEAFQSDQAKIRELSAKKVPAALPVSTPQASAADYLSQADVGMKLSPLNLGHILAGHFNVDSLDSNGSAAQSGVQIGDILMKIGGNDVCGLELSTVTSKLKGIEGTTVQVEFYRTFVAGQFLKVDVSLVRRK